MILWNLCFELKFELLFWFNIDFQTGEIFINAERHETTRIVEVYLAGEI